MALYKRGNTWWMRKQINGMRIDQSLDTTLQRKAEERQAKIIMEIVGGKWGEQTALKRPLSEMIDRFEREYTDHRGYYSKARDKSIFKHFRKFFSEVVDKEGKVTSIVPTLQTVENKIGSFEQWRKSQGATPGTIVKELGLLRRMYNIARKNWKWQVNNPVCEIELPKVSNERVRYLSKDEYKRLFRALDKSPDKWLRPMVVVALGTGLREGNLCGLQWVDVDLPGRMIALEFEVMKNKDYLGIPLPGDVCEVLTKLQKVKSITGHVFHDNGEPLYAVKVQRAFRKVLKEANITNFHFHDLRHTYCSYLRQRGVDLHTIAVLAGHKDMRMTKRYSHLNVDSLRDAVAKLETTTKLRQEA